MADKAVPFFNPTDVLGLYVDANGNRWIQQENGIVETLQRAQGLKANGDEAAHKTHGGAAAGPVVYECHDETGNLALPKVGEVKGGYHIDQVQLAYQPTGWPRLTIPVHQHDSNAHEDGTLNEFSATPVFPAQFGIPRSISNAAAAVVVAIGDADAGMRAMTYTLGCTHVDEDENGDHLAGENRDGIETMQVETTKDPDTVTIHGEWDKLSDGSPKSNTAAETAQIQIEHHVARDA